MKLAVRYNGRAKVIDVLPKGDEGITATVAAMQAVVDHAVFDPRTRPLLNEVVRHVRVMAGAETWREFADELWRWCRARVEFRRDPDGVELLRHPMDLFQRLAKNKSKTTSGDCDDLAMFGCAVLAAAGLRPVLVTVGTEHEGRFKHVFFGVRSGRAKWDGKADAQASVYPLDPQESTPAGQWPPYAERVKLWSLTVSKP